MSFGGFTLIKTKERKHLKFCTLASGSSGNCTLVEGGGTAILIDAGISMRRIKLGLGKCGIPPENLSGILVTHCHSDHVAGLGMMSKYFAVPIFAPYITAGVIAAQSPECAPYITPFEPGADIHIGALKISSFRTMHDAYDSVGYVVSDGDKTMALATDLGCVTYEVEARICGVNAAVIEANHDVDMLKNGPYPYALKRRILEDNGHLSNFACAALAVRLFESGTKRLVLAHLSSENNTPSLAFKTVCAALAERGCAVGDKIAVSVAPRSEASEFFEI